MTANKTRDRLPRKRGLARMCALACAALLPGAAPGQGDAPPARPAQLLFQLDNDLFTGSDRDYTNGARFAYLRPVPEESLNRLQHWLQELSGARRHPLFSRLTAFIDPAEIQYDWGVGLTQLMFTPEDSAAPAAPAGQRPYAGWLGAEFSLHAKDRRALSSVTLALGTTGAPALARQTQEWVHRHISGSPIFQGWSSQAPAEPTLNLNLDRKRRLRALAELSADWPLGLDGYLEWGAAAGNFRTEAYLGALLRCGFNLPVAYQTPRLQLGTYAHELFLDGGPRGRGWSLAGFVGARGSAVAHDITLDGPLFRDHPGAVSSRPLVGELMAGAGLRWQRLSVTVARTFRGREFRGQDHSHQFGSVLVSLAL